MIRMFGACTDRTIAKFETAIDSNGGQVPAIPPLQRTLATYAAVDASPHQLLLLCKLQAVQWMPLSYQAVNLTT